MYIETDCSNAVASVRCLMRWKRDQSSGVFCRLLHGREALRVMGWDFSWFNKAGTQNYDHEFLCTLAGRAFSTYTFTPVCIATLAAMGLYEVKSGEDEKEVDADSSPDCSDSDVL